MRSAWEEEEEKLRKIRKSKSKKKSQKMKVSGKNVFIIQKALKKKK